MATHLTTSRLVAFGAGIALVYAALLPMIAYDLIFHLDPWLNAIVASEGLAVFATPFTNYTGGYVSVLAFWSLASPWLSDVAIIKAAGLTGTALCALGFWLCLKAAGIAGRERTFGTLFFLALPSVAMNGAALAQADAYYTAFVLMALAAAMAGRYVLAGMAFCVALSFKLQAIFVAPFLAGILLRDLRAVILSALALIPLYLATNGLYLVAGRPLGEVLTIYGGQSDYYREVWRGAPNPWIFVSALIPEGTHDTLYGTLVLIGLALAATAGLALLAATLRARPQAPADMVRWAALSALAMPYLLPKMHDRYFFMAEVLLLLLALLAPRFRSAAILAQISAIFVYCYHYDTLGLAALLGGTGAVSLLGVTFMT
ncbi:MAG: hypothetical protein AAF565_13045, partial [Pseudomonadota bacterium]